ncbi:hypothetical protein Rhal01_01383 [Rubritalea halochordaticola]|uniref:ATP-grasp domain-containing protein n=1 Tax=Rubritalea halochordaticola TaxID=714537 RepID=A0ABP9UY86_9BACT
MIAISCNGKGFKDRWIQYCIDKKIPYKVIDCTQSDVISQLTDCSALMWHWHHADPKAILFARQLTYSLEAVGKKVFPDSSTAWHFDDKVGQKYLLESIGAPLVDSTVFYNKDDALDWANRCAYPIVFKLRGGAGARNVKLIRSRRECRAIIRQAFGRGFPAFDRIANFKDVWEKFKGRRVGMIHLLKACGRLFIVPTHMRNLPRDRGYIYFQEFIPGNDSDIRVVVIDRRAFAIRRFCRDGDFRASGSGRLQYLGDGDLDHEVLRISFETTKKLNAQCLAYDFVFDANKSARIVEISYGFSMEAYDNCLGYWDESGGWHPGDFNPQGFMVESILSK